MASQSAETLLKMNFGTIKKMAKPGGWRRGYGYFRDKKAADVKLTKTGVSAKVKGNYKSHYTVGLTFEKEGITPECSCPLDEPWCKHAVSVALTAVDQQLWEQFWKLPLDDGLDADEIAETFEGNYRIYFDPKRKPKKISIQFVDRDEGMTIAKLEPVLRTALDLQNSGQVDFSESEKREFGLMKFLMERGLNKASKDWFDLNISDTDGLMKHLSVMEDVCTNSNERITFMQEPLKLLMSVNVSMAGNVLVSLHWHRKDNDDFYPLEEMTMFNRNAPWAIRKNKIYPLSNTLQKLPNHLTKSTFSDIRDSDGGKFMYEELPKLRKLVEVDEADIVDQLRLEDRPFEKILNLELVDEATLKIRASLDFSYDGVNVPFSRSAPDSPYVMVVKKETETIYWLKRDYKAERAAYEMLLEGRLDPVQTNFLSAEGDDAIDFYNDVFPSLGSEWSLKHDEEAFKTMKVASSPLKVNAQIDFYEAVDHFTMKTVCTLGDKVLDIEEVQRYLMQGKKYFFLPGEGYVEVPLASILQYAKTLQHFDAEKIGTDAQGFDIHKIQTFKAGLIGELVDQGVELDLSEKFQKFWDLISSFSHLEDIPVPEKVNAELRPYQKQGFNWLWFLYSYGLDGILADDMGLGKTLQALVMLQHAKDQDGGKPNLIVCPTSVVYNWMSEIRKFTPELTVMNLTGPDRHTLYKKIEDADIILTSYAILRRDIKALKNYPFRCVILDESQNIKNFEAQTAKAAKQLQSTNRLAMSGTPIENRLVELWSVFDFLMPSFLYDIDEFRYRFVVPIEEKGNIDAERRLRQQVAPFILRRLKKDVAKDLPAKVENITYCELTEKQQDLYLDILEKSRDEVFAAAADGGTNKNSIFAVLRRLQQICCHPRLIGDMANGVDESGKYEVLKEKLREIVENGHRVLLFSQFVEMLKIVRSSLEVEGIPYEYLTGETKAEERQNIVDRFNRDESIPICLMSLKAGGTGINLTGADYVIIYDPWWNPAAEDQAIDRAHRIGQTKNVFVYRMVCKGTVEDKILALQETKRDLVDSIISADQGKGKALSFNDLKSILTPDF
ncbi:MAG: DEAD/DEAH box helicase [Vampirovibrio sp.]|nr:DEAD/DEAH box helicase [Vampirovibrio sp.]